MKRIVLRVSLVLGAALVSALPVLAGEGAAGSMGQDQREMKNECLLMAMNCANQVDTIQQRIERISREIGKGSSVYTDQELMHLRRQLEDANRTLEFLNENSGA